MAQGPTPQRIQMQLSLIQSERDRLATCIDQIIKNAERLAEGVHGATVSRLQQDNYKLLQMLTEWADAAEARLSEAPSIPAASPPPEPLVSVSPQSVRSTGGTQADLPVVAAAGRVVQTVSVEEIAAASAHLPRLVSPAAPALLSPGSAPVPPAITESHPALQLTQNSVQDVQTPSDVPSRTLSRSIPPMPTLGVSPTDAVVTMCGGEDCWMSGDNARDCGMKRTVAGGGGVAFSAATCSAPGPRYTTDHAGSQSQNSATSFHTAVTAERNSVSGERLTSRLSDHISTQIAGAPSTNTECRSSTRTVGAKSSQKVMATASSLVQRHLQNKKNALEQNPTASSSKAQQQPVLEMGSRKAVVFSCWPGLMDYLYLNRKEDLPMLESLQARLKDLIGQRQGRLPCVPVVGDLVAAPWMDGWFRAEVRDVTDTYPAMLKLYYIDYGNTGTCSVNNVCFLPAGYKIMPPAAYKCVARNLRWTGQSLTKLQVRVLEHLLSSPNASVSAIFHYTPISAVYQVDLVSEVSLGDHRVSTDVVAMLNKALELNPKLIREMEASTVLDVAPLLVEWHSQISSEMTEQATYAEMGPHDKVQSWLDSQHTQKQPKPEHKKTLAGNKSPGAVYYPPASNKKESVTGGVKGHAPRLRELPQYQGLQLAWSARPLRQLPTTNDPLMVCVLNALTPELFYISIGDSDKCDRMQERLQDVYSRLPVHPQQLVSHLLIPGSYWVAQRPSDAHWYRCVVLDQSPRSDKEDVTASYPVLWVDFGDQDTVPLASFRPITVEFASIPLFAARARCAGVCPLNNEECFSSETCQLFRDLVQDSNCLAYPVVSETTEECLGVILELQEDGRAVPVTELLVGASLVQLRHPELAELVLCSVPDPWDESDDHPPPGDVSEWDPMGEDYVSPYNRVGAEGPGDLGTRTHRDPEDQVCPIFARGGNCWDGIACKRRHVRGGDQQPQQTAVFVSPPGSLRLPRVNTSVLVRVTEVRSPSSFHVQLVYGATPAHMVDANPDEHLSRVMREETLESLTAAMTAACRAKTRLDYSEECLPAVGELVLAPWQNGYHRARVTNLRLAAETLISTAEMFLVDTGVVIECSVKDLRLMEKHFNLLAYQAVPCTLGFVRPPDGRGGWTRRAVERFVQLVSSVPMLLATVLSHRSDGGLELDLCVSQAGERVLRVNQTLVQEGLASRRSQRLPGVAANAPLVPM